MSEERTTYQAFGERSESIADDPILAIDACVIIVVADYVKVSRHELEQEHTHLLGRLQQLRRLLGYTPLPTGKQLRREQHSR